MKTGIKKFLAMSSMALLFCTACKKSDQMVVSNGGTAGSLTANTSTVVLEKADLADTTSKITFNFTSAKYNFSAASTTTLQIDSVGDNWKNPASAAFAPGVLSQPFNTANFNALLLKVVPGGQTSAVNARIQYTVGANTSIYSNVIPLTVTPFSLASYIYIVGAFQGWSASSPDSLASQTNNGVYSAIIDFTAGNNQFLILPAKNFDNKYATNDTSTPSKTVTYNAPNNLIAPSDAGNYLVTFDSNAGTITFKIQ